MDSTLGKSEVIGTPDGKGGGETFPLRSGGEGQKGLAKRVGKTRTALK